MTPSTPSHATVSPAPAALAASSGAAGGRTAGGRVAGGRTAPVPARVLAVLVLLGALVVAALPAPSASAAPATRTPGRTIEVYSRYQPQTTCSPQAQPGVVAFMTMTLRAYPGTGSSGIVRPCSTGGRSEHKEGRAWDWRLSTSNPRHRAQASDLTRWLFATDAYNNQRAQARRLGIMYIIWNRKIWSSTSPEAGWRPYGGADPHTDHMHLSFSVLGAQRRTSFWTGLVPPSLVPVAPAPPVLGPAPAPAPVQPPLDAGSSTVDVPGDGTTVTTPFALRAGRRYLLTASGTYRYGDGDLVADAECSRRPDGSWRTTSAWEGDPGHGHLDLEVAGEPADWTPRTDGGDGCDLDGHAYTRTVLATRDAPLTLRVVDDVLSDNGGSLTLQVSVLDTAPTTD